MLSRIKINAIFLLILCCWARAALEPRWLFEPVELQQHIEIPRSEVVNPAILDEAVHNYQQKNYRVVIDQIQKLHDLELPDGNHPWLSFLLAECYRGVGIDGVARKNYQSIIGKKATCDYTAPAMLRQLQYAVKYNELLVADTLMNSFVQRFLSHPLASAMHFEYARFMYKIGRLNNVKTYADRITANSSFWFKGRMLVAMSFIQADSASNAQSVLDLIAEQATQKHLADEARILSADIDAEAEQFTQAITKYRLVEQSSPLYPKARIRMVRSLMQLKRFEQAQQVCRSFLQQQSHLDYQLEMASLLAEMYELQGQEQKAQQIKGAVTAQLTATRLSFEIYRELQALATASEELGVLQRKAIEKQLDEHEHHALDSLRSKIRFLTSQNKQLLNLMRELTGDERSTEGMVQFIAHQRYLEKSGLLTEKSEELRMDVLNEDTDEQRLIDGIKHLLSSEASVGTH